jgi:hypothetical protein
MKFAWIAVNEATDAAGFYLEDGPELREIERRVLKAWGAPGTEHIQFHSILPEDRDEAMVEADVPEEFAKWAKQHQETGEENVENGVSNLVYYEDDALADRAIKKAEEDLY